MLTTVFHVFFFLSQLFYGGSAEAGDDTMVLNFSMSSEHKSWYDAAISCQSEGTRLLYANTSENVLVDILEDFNTTVSVWLDDYFSFSPFVWIKGCYRSSNATGQIPDVTPITTLVTVDKCVDLCEGNATYVGIQNNSCFCLSDISLYSGNDPSSCDHTCLINETETCGRDERMSIFEIANVSVGNWHMGSLGTKECVYIFKNKDKLEWRSWWCGSINRSGYICEEDFSCPNNSTNCTTGSRHLVIDIHLSWADSMNDCQEKGGYLSSFKTSKELEDSNLFNQLDESKTYWIGLWRRRRQHRITGKDVPNVEYCYLLTKDSNHTVKKGPSRCNVKKKYVCQKEHIATLPNSENKNGTDDDVLGIDGNGADKGEVDGTHVGYDDDYKTSTAADPKVKDSTKNENDDSDYYGLYVGITLAVLVMLTIVFLLVLLLRQRRKRRVLVVRHPSHTTYKYSQCNRDSADNEMKTPPKKPLRRNVSKPPYENVIICPSGKAVLEPEEQKHPEETKEPTVPPKGEETTPTMTSDIPFIDANLSKTEKQKYDRSTSLLSDQLDVIDQEIEIESSKERCNSVGNGNVSDNQDDVFQPTSPRSVSVQSDSDVEIGV